uniref:Rhodanese domain-containing protein n=1 Tax=Rhizochromulina marina TaxID=1034831 RepID=A0A7S2RKG5_9STRA
MSSEPAGEVPARPKLAIRTESTPSYATMSVEALAEELRGREGGRGVVVVDVRGDDRKGGHIPSSQWVAFPAFEAQAADRVAAWCSGGSSTAPAKICFYCQYSSERGPSCALTCAAKVAEAGFGDRAEVYLLQGGFHKWLNTFLGTGNEAALIEGFDPSLWVQQDSSWVYAPDVPFDFSCEENLPLHDQVEGQAEA